MGQGAAAIELPDPNQTAAATPMASADDLLAQLAGEEIDRLLAEAEVETPAPAPTERAAHDSATTLADDAANAKTLDAELSEAPLAIVPPPPAPAFSIPEPLPASPVTPKHVDAAPSAIDSSSAEMRALLDDESDSAASAQRGVADSGPTPFYVRVLEVINSPLDSVPDGLRETLGKVAILTLFNSLAVLLYVIFIRQR